MSIRLKSELRRQLIEADDHRCAYCRTTQANTGYPMVVDHITPRSKDGPTSFENLCFACNSCNLFKQAQTALTDPLTGTLTPLFHPRLQVWSEHFAWDSTGIYIQGLTSTGRVTVMALNMNNDVIVDARRNWVRVGWHPPDNQ